MGKLNEGIKMIEVKLQGRKTKIKKKWVFPSWSVVTRRIYGLLQILMCHISHCFNIFLFSKFILLNDRTIDLCSYTIKIG